MNDSFSEMKNEGEPHTALNVKIPESLKLNAKEYASYLGIPLQKFVADAIADKISANADIAREVLTLRGQRISHRLAEVTAMLELVQGLEQALPAKDLSTDNE